MTVTRNQVEPLTGETDMSAYDADTDPRETAHGADDPPRRDGLGEHPWLLQVSLKTPAGTLINVRGMNSWDIATGLSAIQSLASEIAATEALFGAHGALAPLNPRPVAPPAQPRQQWGQQPQAQPQQWGGQPQAQQGQQAPMCDHGMPAKFVQGGISKAGRPYKAFWACAMPQGQQCRFRGDA